MSNLFGAVVSDEVSNGGNWGKFGLNQDAKLVKVEISAAENGSWKAVDVDVRVGENKKFLSRMFFPNPNVIYGKNDEGVNGLLQEGDENYQKTLDKAYSNVMAAIVHVVKASGVTQEDINIAVDKAKATSMEEWADAVVGLVSVSEDKPAIVDVFLQYQYKPGKDQTKTFLELPSKITSGKFLVPATGKSWKEVKTSTKLSYVTEEGDKHVFERNEYFLNSTNANRIGVEEESTTGFSATTEDSSTETSNGADW